MLKVDNLEVEIEGVQVLRGISFALESGKTTVLIGRNGAGKTTTLRAIMGLLPVASGTVSLAGEPLLDKPAFSRAPLGIGYAPEDRRLIAEFSVRENILLSALALNMAPAERKRRLDETYALIPQLETLDTRPGGSVSGGQGKIVALGRALMVADRVLLLDEPFQGLAPALALDYARALKRLKREKRDIAYMITESSPDLLSSVADETLTIERGMVTGGGQEAELA